MLDVIERGVAGGEEPGAEEASAGAASSSSLPSSVTAALASLRALAAMRGRHLCIIPPSTDAVAEKEGLTAAVASSISTAAASTMSLLVSAALGGSAEGAADASALGSPTTSMSSDEVRATLCPTARFMLAKKLVHVSILGGGGYAELKRLVEARGSSAASDLLVAPISLAE